MSNQSCKPDLEVKTVQKLSDDLYLVNGKYYQRATLDTEFYPGQVVFVNSKRNPGCYSNNELVVIENSSSDSDFVTREYPSCGLWKDSCFIESEIVPVGSIKKNIVDTSVRHPHADLMIQYANDKTLKIESSVDGKSWEEVKYPSWNSDLEYRIKPKTKKVIKYKYAFLKSSTSAEGISAGYYLNDSEFTEHLPYTNFQRLDFTAKEFEIPND